MAEDLINIGIYCSNIMVKHGKKVKICNAVYNPDDNIIEFSLVYNYINEPSYKYFKYIINACNFMITDNEVLVNNDTIDLINKEIEKVLYIKTLSYGK